MPKAKAQPTAFDTTSKAKATEVFEVGATDLTIEVPRFDCVTVAEELAIIELYSGLDESTLQVQLDINLALLLLERTGKELEEEDLMAWGLPTVKAMAQFLIDERREHKAQFTEDAQEDGSPKAGGSTAPD